MFEITSTKSCAYCTKAKLKLDDLGLPYYETVLETPEQKFAFSQAGFKTVPQIYHNGNHIGGYTDLVSWLQENHSPAS